MKIWELEQIQFIIFKNIQYTWIIKDFENNPDFCKGLLIINKKKGWLRFKWNFDDIKISLLFSQV